MRAWPGMERRVRPVQPCSDCSAQAWSGEMDSMLLVQPVRTGRLPTGPSPSRPLTPADHRQHGRRESSVVLEQPRKCWGGTALPFPAPWVLGGGAGSGRRAPAGRSSAPPLPPDSASWPADPLHPAAPRCAASAALALRGRAEGSGSGQLRDECRRRKFWPSGRPRPPGGPRCVQAGPREVSAEVALAGATVRRFKGDLPGGRSAPTGRGTWEKRRAVSSAPGGSEDLAGLPRRLGTKG